MQDNNQNKSFNESSESDNDKLNEEENGLLKKSSKLNLENENSSILKNENINNNNFNIIDDAIKKSKTCKEENSNRLNINRVSENGLNHLATVLETIKEVSNSRAGSSEICRNNNNKNNNNNNNISIKTIKK